MRFRLTYQGRLQGNGRPSHKHEIRCQFHEQLKRLWEVHPPLQRFVYTKHTTGWDAALEGFENALDGRPSPPPRHMRDVLSERFNRFGYQFVPLATEDLNVSVGLDVLFLRHEPPGSFISSGDIDNRLKTLFDALQVPQQASEMSNCPPAAEGQCPLFVLFDNDKIVSKLTVETDRLLQPISDAGQIELSDTRVVIGVTIVPYTQSLLNMAFA